MASGVKVLLVDENDDFVDALGAWLEVEIDGLHVVGRAHSLAEALEQAARHRPDLIVADTSLPDESGFEIARRLAAAAPSADIVLLTLLEDHAVGAQARAAGADACIAKTRVTTSLVPALRMLLAARGASMSKDGSFTDKNLE